LYELVGVLDYIRRRTYDGYTECSDNAVENSQARLALC
jgi:hypothetical protein